MIFQHTWQKVLSGEKTQTRRIWKPGYEWDVNGLKNGNRIQYAVGQPIALQPGRGKKSIGRLVITSMTDEDVRTIDRKDVEAEGFNSRDEFMQVWRSMHGENYHALVIRFRLEEVY